VSHFDDDLTWLQCEQFERQNKKLCTQDNAWLTDRDTCQNKCDSLVGCQSFTYSINEGKCWLSRLGDKELDGACGKRNGQQSLSGFESWTTECTTTTKCDFCDGKCEHAEILDLRFIAWSNLGGLGPNVTHVLDGSHVPPTIMYWNVFNATKNEDVVYLEVKNVTRYESGLTAEEMLRDPNGNSQESEAEFEIRKREYPNGVTPTAKMYPHNRMQELLVPSV